MEQGDKPRREQPNMCEGHGFQWQIMAGINEGKMKFHFYGKYRSCTRYIGGFSFETKEEAEEKILTLLEEGEVPLVEGEHKKAAMVYCGSRFDEGWERHAAYPGWPGCSHG